MRNIMLVLMAGAIFSVGCGPEKSAIERAQEQEDANEKYKDDKEEAREKIKVDRRKKELATVEGFYFGFLQSEDSVSTEGPCRPSDIFTEAVVSPNCHPVSVELEVISDFAAGQDGKLKEVPKLRGEMKLYNDKAGFQKRELFYIFVFSSGDYDKDLKLVQLTVGKGGPENPDAPGNYSFTADEKLPLLDGELIWRNKKNRLFIERR